MDERLALFESQVTRFQELLNGILANANKKLGWYFLCHVEIFTENSSSLRMLGRMCLYDDSKDQSVQNWSKWKWKWKWENKWEWEWNWKQLSERAAFRV